jgi:hypothetical protein
MKLIHRMALAGFAAGIFAIGPAAAQTGSIRFTVRITPSTGVAEPVRGFPIYLLSKSYADISKEAAASVPKPVLEKFIDSLTVSKELKAWMKEHHTVTITGDVFTDNLKPDEILNIPEFWNAYLDRNAGDKLSGFPSPKYKPMDQTRNPEKYQRAMVEYRAAVRKYIVTNPQSKDGMDLDLDAIDPSHKWEEKVDARGPEIRRLTLDLAQSKYSLAQTVTDDNGRGGFANVAPGTYWLSSLGIEAQVGDTREVWDTSVTVGAGPATQIVLANFNAVPPAKPSS